MATKKNSTKLATNKNNKKSLNNSKQKRISWKYAAIFIILVAAIGGYAVYKTYASSVPKNLVSTPAAVVGRRVVRAQICQSGQNKVYVRFSKDDGDKYTDYAPELVFARQGVRTGQIKGYKTWLTKSYPQAAYTEGYQILGNQSMGNRRATDTVKIKYAGAQGSALYWRQIPYCQY